jgi:hypothetical protein
MGDGDNRPNGFTILAFLFMAGAYSATVILLLLAPFLSDAPIAWAGIPTGLVLIWLGWRVATGKWAR